MSSRCEGGKYLVPDIHNLSHLVAAAVLRQQSAVIPAGKKSLCDVSKYKCPSPQVRLPACFDQSLSLTRFNRRRCTFSSFKSLATFWPSFFFFSVFFFSPFSNPVWSWQARPSVHNALELGGEAGLWAIFIFFLLDTDSCCSAQKKTLVINKKYNKIFPNEVDSQLKCELLGKHSPLILSVVIGRCSGSLCRRLDVLSDGGFASSCSELHFFIGWAFFFVFFFGGRKKMNPHPQRKRSYYLKHHPAGEFCLKVLWILNFLINPKAIHSE